MGHENHKNCLNKPIGPRVCARSNKILANIFVNILWNSSLQWKKLFIIYNNNCF